MLAMTPRQRFLASLSHQPVDRAPIDLGGSIVSGINAQAYQRLKTLLRLDLGQTQIFDRMNQLAVIDPEVSDLLGIDTLGILPGEPENSPTIEDPENEAYTDEWGLYKFKPLDRVVMSSARPIIFNQMCRPKLSSPCLKSAWVVRYSNREIERLLQSAI
jgi:hypothetical protein